MNNVSERLHGEANNMRVQGRIVVADIFDCYADEVAQLEGDKGVIVIGDGLRVGKMWVENLILEKARLESIREAGEEAWMYMFDDIPQKLNAKRRAYEKFYEALEAGGE